MKNKPKTKTLVLTALCAALIAVATITVRIPTPSTDGYFNVGDAVILVTSALLGGLPSMLAAAIGSALGDLIAGFPQWILATAVIKGAEGLLCGLLLKYAVSRINNAVARAALGTFVMLVSSLLMVCGYFFASWIMSGYGYAVASVIPNLIQAAVCVAIASILIYAVRLPKLLAMTRKRQAVEPPAEPKE